MFSKSLFSFSDWKDLFFFDIFYFKGQNGILESPTGREMLPFYLIFIKIIGYNRYWKNSLSTVCITCLVGTI